ncbi:hypothetical protein Pth03_39150 [Planotetraspora thailandica]|uniref:Uncharacterized protein n=1 Tax=Planotetraspora thailandica TaxID=487172 RepID=A0A8J3V2I9_9ACTN|nr:hypothetical protein Pth03_39150 [Planotetraspora thailandica]
MTPQNLDADAVALIIGKDDQIHWNDPGHSVPSIDAPEGLWLTCGPQHQRIPVRPMADQGHVSAFRVWGG